MHAVIRGPGTTEIGEEGDTPEELLIVKMSALDVPPTGAGLKTVTLAVPGLAVSAAEISAVNPVLLIKVVDRLDPFHLTTDPLMKFVPFTVSVKPVPPAVADVGLILDIVGAGLVGTDWI